MKTIMRKITQLEIPNTFVNQLQKAVRELQKFQSSIMVKYKLFLMNRRQTLSINHFSQDVHGMLLPPTQHQLVFFYQGNGLQVQFCVQPMNCLLFWN